MGNRRDSNLILVLLALLVMISIHLPALISAGSKTWTVPTIFNFGDSNSDTGGRVAGTGFVLPFPYGRVFFQRSTGRFSDGRLVIDFLCEHVNSSYMSPYLEGLGSNFTTGANFAISGAATQVVFVPFTLSMQVQQFLHFRSRSLELFAQGSKSMINDEGFKNALHAFDIGQNDLSGAFDGNLSYSQVINRIPSILIKIEDAIETVYKSGGRNFWIHSTGPLGCLPQKLGMFKHETKDLDACGCLASFNNASRVFNTGLGAICNRLRSQMKGTTVIYTDLYTIKYDIVCNYRKYGFMSPFMACCGSGGPPYNFNSSIWCGQPGTRACAEGSRRISWDGVHYTEAANAIVASKILSSRYSKPHVKFEKLFNYK